MLGTLSAGFDPAQEISPYRVASVTIYNLGQKWREIMGKTPRAKPTRRRAKRAPSRAVTKGRAISVAGIIAMLRQVLDPHGIYPVELKKPIGDYIRGGAAARRAFFAVANRAFQDYGLNLKPGDLANVKTLQGLVDVIAGWFRRHGYQVT